MQKVLALTRKVAKTNATVLITGETGTGKTWLAKLIHDCSLRGSGPFSVLNCATLSESLLESELFGHVRGAFTGACKDKLGRLQQANSGTLFLDEVGEISLSVQTKLLRFLQDREFERVGDTRTVHVDVRILAATNRSLRDDVLQGRFRQDLFFRLNVIELQMPPLRMRKEEIIPLAEELLICAFQSNSLLVRPMSVEVKDVLLAYDWPGNIRELKNVMERAAILCSEVEIITADLPDHIL